MYFHVMYDQVELRAFCSKHSDLQEDSSILPSGGSVAFGSEFSVANSPPATLPAGGEHNSKIGCRNGDSIGIVSDASPDKLRHNNPQDGELSDRRLSACDMLECGSSPQLNNSGVLGRADDNVNASDSLGFALVLKKVFWNTSK